MVVQRSVRVSGSVGFGWHIHGALESWTARADLKASIMLTVEAGAFAFAVTVPGLVRGASGMVGTVAAVGVVVALLAAMVAAASAVLPVLGSPRRHRRERDQHLLYFGHLRLWQPSELAVMLGRMTDQQRAEMLARQLVVMSRLNWRKHRLLQASVALAVLAALSIAVATVLAPPT
jgi:hypothetical protein